MSSGGQLHNRVKTFRQQRGWSQEELARRAGISRAAVSAIEIQRLVPSVESALALARTFGCRVEDLFGENGTDEISWAWPPPVEPCRFWHAEVGGRQLLFPVEATAAGVLAHDGVFREGVCTHTGEAHSQQTLVMASCDPAAAMLASEYARSGGFRLLVLQRSSREALELLRRGLVDVAGIHLASGDHDEQNAAAVRTALGAGHSLLRVTRWQEGLAVGPTAPAGSLRTLLGAKVRWVGREPGSGARQCQDEVLGDHAAPRRLARDHRGVAEAVRCGWADVGVCVRLVCEEAGLRFIRVREAAYDLCFATAKESEPRIRTLIETVRAVNYRRWLAELPGYDGSGGELSRVV
jgi:molybdate-binding protein/DNA-binding XRE family transcriptional regulator